MSIQNCLKIIILLAPSAGGKDTVISELAKQEIAFPCRRDTTRDERPGDNGHYRFLTAREFRARQRQNKYVLDHFFSHHYFGVPIEEIRARWTEGKVPVVKGDARDVARAREKIRLFEPAAVVRTILLLPEPFDFWITKLKERNLPDVLERIRSSKRELQGAMGPCSDQIDHLVLNYYGDLQKTIAELARVIAG